MLTPTRSQTDIAPAPRRVHRLGLGIALLVILALGIVGYRVANRRMKAPLSDPVASTNPGTVATLAVGAPGHEGRLVGDAHRVTCGSLPVSVWFVIAMNAESCWALITRLGYSQNLLAGVDPDDRDRGQLVMNVLDPDHTTVRLDPESGRAIIYEVTLQAVCFTTTRDVVGAYDLENEALVASGDADCPQPPNYTPGESWTMDCQDTAFNFGDKTKDHDCWTLAITATEVGTMAGSPGFDPNVGSLAIEIPGASTEGGPTRSSTDEGKRFVIPAGLTVGVPGGDPTITRVTASAVCFRTAKGEGYWDLTKGELVMRPEPSLCG